MQSKGSSCNLPAQWAGGARARNLAAHFALQNTNSVGAKSEGAAEGGVGGNSAAPEPEVRQRPDKLRSRRLLGQSRSQQKSFLFLLPARRSLGAGGEEKIGRAQIRKAEKTFLLAGERQRAAAGRSGWFRSGISDKMSSSGVVKTHIKKS